MSDSADKVALPPAEIARLIGTVLAGRYEVTGVLGAGGMGVVLEARQIAMDRKVAVKLLHPSFGANRHAVARFVREMQVTSRLEHASTVRVYDFGEATIPPAAGEAGGTQLFLVMELVQGRTLGKVLAEGPKALSHARTAAIGAQIARALEAAHGEGIVHRDLKPDNVMLVDRYGRADVVKVLDFGIARFIEGAEGEGVGKLTAEGAVVGTPAYMSPEQATGAAIGPASDLYSLGVMLFEMATGVVPFTAPTTVSLMVKHVQEAPPRPSDLKSMPARLDELILACLSKTPEQRPGSAREVADALEALARELAPPETDGARIDRERLAEQKAKMSAADTSKEAARRASEADTAKRLGSDELPPPKAARPWWLAAALAVAAGAVVFALVSGRDDGARMSIAAAEPLERVDAQAADAGAQAAAEVVAAADLHEREPAAPPTCAIEPVARARAAVDARAADAVASAREALRACPDWAVAHVVAGRAEQLAKAWDAARAAYLRARELAPEWGVPRFNLALAERLAGDPKAARATLAQLLAMAPAWPNARLLKAQVALDLRDFEEARRDAEAATEAAPESATAWYLLGEVQRAAGDAGSQGRARVAYCKAKALGMSAASDRCDAPPGPDVTQ